MAAKGKSSKNKKKKSDEEAAMEERKRRSRFVLAILGVALIVVLTFMLSRTKQEATVTPQENSTESPVDINLPGNVKFEKDGELTFLTSGSIQISTIEIEIAKTRLETTQGLMYRNELKPDQGMLFIFPYERPQSFWMKNTQIPLDIIFVNANMSIVTIREDAIPFDESSYASTEPAKFVVEVNAGYAHEHGIKVGDKIKWTETL